jgi:16S rRNA (adenine1518-N6/adenine1519-N6)-dimethyltransferase
MSAVVHITPKDAASGVKMSVLENLTGAAFGQRRKMLRQSLKGVPGALAALHKTGIAEDRRPETINIAEWCALAREVG